MLKGLSVSILAATTLFSAGSGAVLAEPLQASTVEAKAVSQASSYVSTRILWGPVAGASYYRVAIRDLNSNQRIVVDHQYKTYYDATNLTRGNQYRFWFGAYDNDGRLIAQGETIETVYGNKYFTIPRK
ncbi:hypothetical protein M5X00_25420 [Paenibacillus alvei]|uniref:Fibronectin type III domain-containing protein n=1 Tax=Paenibacillus alvei TaxID=44250 RepID=A0AAP7A1X2_PAEAL|nr:MULTISPECIES: hypothetical protein [Paenibacillus]EJW14570.1 hypothetical protein PAV_12c00320 [Paenibacillus alvei DSM 29]MCY9544625.1 hypothetical protein [Paenibacillus alvei]MCY9706378.1 hypothetical protein [Paenibacillus alvei]MCY9737153.1 hypothetical protein [Paenibacillus alvei]MCY9757572.1 hypothetical protein [Paenibacillus alvei]